MASQAQRAAGFFVGSLVVAILGAVALPRLLGLAAGPEAEVISLIAKTEGEGMSLPVPSASAPLVAQRHHFDRITVRVDPVAGTAEAVSTLDFTGLLGATVVSSLGVERTGFHQVAHRWVPDGSWAPRLQAVVSALEAHRQAVQAGDERALGALGGDATYQLSDGLWERAKALSARDFRVKAWYVRTDREDAVVTEEYRLTGALPDRPVDEVGTRQLKLERRGGEFLFSQGLR